MSDLQKSYNYYIVAKENCERIKKDVRQKTEELNASKLELSELRPRLVEIDRIIDNARKGVKENLSMDELTSLKKESYDKHGRFNELIDFVQITKNSQGIITRQSISASANARLLKNKVTETIIDKAAAEAVSSSTVSLKDLTHTAMSLHGLNFKNADRYVLYQKIGEAICNQLFISKNDCLALPSIQQSISKTDLLLDNLA